MAKNRVTIVGLGQRGMHMAAALRPAVQDIELVGHDKAADAARRASEAKLVDKTEWNLLAACEGARLIVLALPQAALTPTLRALDGEIDADAIVLDLCPGKAASLKAASGLPNDITYVSGELILNPARAESAIPGQDALNDAIVALTPRPGSGHEGVDALIGILSHCGAQPVLVEAAEHDGFTLSLRALPTAVSGALVEAVTGDGAWNDRKWMAGRAFQKATGGVEGEDAQAMADALLANPDVTRHWINRIITELVNLREDVDDGQGDAVRGRLTRAAEARAAWLADWKRGRGSSKAPADIAPPNLLGALMGETLANRLRGDKKPGNK